MAFARLLRTRVLPLAAAALVVAGATVLVDQELNPARRYLSGTVRIGINGNLPGWSFPPDDDAAGFDVELAAFLRDKYGFDLELVPMQPDERERKLLDGRVDLVIANFSANGLSMTDPSKRRSQVMDFAGPYYSDVSGVMWYSKDIADGNSGGLSDDSAAQVCVSNGTTAPEYMDGKGIPEDQLECFKRFVDETDYEILGVVTDQSILIPWAVHNKIGEPIRATWNYNNVFPINDELYGIAMPDSSPALCDELNSAIDEFLSAADGWDRAFDAHLSIIGNKDEKKPQETDSSWC